jgi:hypothetical protein
VNIGSQWRLKIRLADEILELVDYEAGKSILDMLQLMDVRGRSAIE